MRMFGFLRSLRCWRSTIPKLHRAVGDNNVTKKKLQRSNIENVDGEGRTIIFYAAMFSNVRTMQLILQEAKRRKREYLIHVPELNGTTALHMAANRGDKEIIKLLIEAGANIHQADRRNLLPWHYARDPENIEVMRLLGASSERLVVANSESMVNLCQRSSKDALAESSVKKEAERSRDSDAIEQEVLMNGTGLDPVEKELADKGFAEDLEKASCAEEEDFPKHLVQSLVNVAGENIEVSDLSSQEIATCTSCVNDEDSPQRQAASEELYILEVGRQVAVNLIDIMQPLAPYTFLLWVIAVNVIFACLLSTLN